MDPKARSGAENERTVLAPTSTAGAVTPLHGPRSMVGQPQADPMLGLLLAGAYRVERVLGEGGMGLLYEATHLRIERRYAVKLIHVPLASMEEIRARFEREARVMSRVRSDHVVDVVDVVQAPDGRTCIVSELLEGEDLEQYARRSGGRLAAGEAVTFIRQCLHGLRAAYALGVVHRDLKPSNLFLSRDSAGAVTLKILDFGVAKLGGDAELTATGVVVGTPAYMAPEQARDATLADHRSDLYAVGAVLYRLVTGKSPYAGSDANGTLIQLMEQAPQRPSAIERSITPGLEAVIEKAMARDPGERFQSAEELDRALAPFDGGQGGTTRSHITMAGGGDDAATLGRKARLMRPSAVLSAVGIAMAAGAAVAAALSMLVGGLSEHKEMSTTELVLVIIGAAVACSAAGVGAGRSLAAAWRNVAMVERRRKQFVNALVAGSSVFGALELAALLWAVLHGSEARSPFWAATRVLAALIAATAVAVLGKRRA
jgi:tRNA A-37 threonylcarbamoyl transferase component Bud32